MACKMWDGIIYPFRNFISIGDTAVLHLGNDRMDVVTYPAWNWGRVMLVKRTLGVVYGQGDKPRQFLFWNIAEFHSTKLT